MNGMIFDIQRMSVHDGPGIRTTVFFKGCPLRCVWCHNPESQKNTPQLAYYQDLCIGCRECLSVCPHHCHSAEEGQHLINRRDCVGCGQCAASCTGALVLLGKPWTVEEVMRVVLRDRRFYETSGGGITLSGGEPLAQPEFASALLQAAKDAGLHTCMETSGYAPAQTLEAIAPLVDLFLYDLKETDPIRHKEYTGVSNERILDNLFLLDRMGRPFYLRCPIIPGMNDREEHLLAIADLANRLNHVQMIHIEPYNSFGEGKSSSIGASYALSGLEMPEDGQVAHWVAAVQSATSVKVIKS